MAVDKKQYDLPLHTDIAWCPGCGNFPILNIVKMALAELDLAPEQVVLCSGIGQAAKTPQYMRVNYFNGLHGDFDLHLFGMMRDEWAALRA